MHVNFALLISTTCQRFGLGLFIFALIAASFMGFSPAMNDISLYALVLLAIGGIASAFHLGRPNRFFNAFSNFKSHLTQEAFVTPFLGIALLLCAADGRLFNLGGFSFILLWVTFILAVLFLVSTGLVYQVNARPAWNTPLVLLIFLLTSAQAGTLSVLALAVSAGSVPVSLSVVTGVAFVLCVVAQYLFIQRLKGLIYGVAVDVTKQPYVGNFTVWLIFGVVAAAVCLVTALTLSSSIWAWAAVASSVIGILSWTSLFFQSALTVKMFPMYNVDLNVYF